MTTSLQEIIPPLFQFLNKDSFINVIFRNDFVLLKAFTEPTTSNSFFSITFKGLVTNYGEGGATKREGGAREVLPLREGGAEKVLAILKGGHKKFWGSFDAVA